MLEGNLLSSILKACIIKDDSGSIHWNEWRLLFRYDLLIELNSKLYRKIKELNFGEVDYVLSLGKSGIILGAIVSQILKKPLLLFGGKYPDDPQKKKIHPRDINLDDKNILLVDTLLKRGAVLYSSINYLIKNLNSKPKSLSALVLINVDCWKERMFITNLETKRKDYNIIINSIYSINNDFEVFEEVLGGLNYKLEEIEKMICEEKDFWTYSQEGEEINDASDISSFKTEPEQITIIHDSYIDIRLRPNIDEFYNNNIKLKKGENCCYFNCNGWNKYNEFLMNRYDEVIMKINNIEYDYIATSQLSYLPILIYISLQRSIPSFFIPDFGFQKESTLSFPNIDLKGKNFCLIEGESHEFETVQESIKLIEKMGGNIKNIIFFPAR